MKHGSFPGKAGIQPVAAYFQELAEWISAFDGTTAPWIWQMTPLLSSVYSSSGMMHPTSPRREFGPRRTVFCISYPKNVKAEIST